MGLSDLAFADLAVEQDPAASRYKRFSDDLRLVSVPETYWGELQALRNQMEAHNSHRFRMVFGGMNLRVQKRDTPYGAVFIARRIASILRKLDDIGLPIPLVQTLRDARMRSGLLLFAGGPGMGKTTLGCALLMDRLERIGGFTWTAENPVEYDLQGSRGNGQCYQEEIDDDTEVQRVFMDTLRSGADTFYIGEIREQSAAKTAGLAAASGMLVISTLHADNPQQAILKMGMLSGFDGLAQCLRGVVTLRIDKEPAGGAMPGGGMPGGGVANGKSPQSILHVQSFFVEDEPTRMKIRDGNMAAINQDIEAQKNRSMSMGRIYGSAGGR
ncbi:Flp pilus assembly complex ATPase component TadA [Acidithiobacillus thiooxidans]|uniref:ATPase, T2SS/T4P/T4SS family n=1 Tax=Acidithiobacillus thiooxidans TaxID=930 RepID=UPI001C077697|nr:ATPase, T2SS/T4P/T4SS family [Acidithiobacillus thiooxidans]MBU2742278.1 Flp pilus assembly complex ATPase component TadA [Acidithiobacillus albertensis]MBU2794465.1 Flp pilus assembly complex ATPase component TadA [Acidithiobacillus thiooxidans]